MDFQSLSATKHLGEHIDLVTYQGIDVLRINHPLFTAGVATHGAHLLWFQPSNEAKPVIWMSEKAEFAKDKAIRGGVPVCWPWFGKLANPSHGFARTSEWQILSHESTDDKLTLRLGLEDTEQTREIWPHKFKLVMNFEFSQTLKISLDVTNTDESEWVFSGALHTYFNLGDINHTLVTGMGETYLDNLNTYAKFKGQKLLGFNRETDRVYPYPEANIRIHDRLNRRTIVVSNQGDNAAVIWNPWQELSKNMVDMADDSYMTMVCVEAAVHAQAKDQGIKLAPNQSHQLSTFIEVAKH